MPSLAQLHTFHLSSQGRTVTSFDSVASFLASYQAEQNTYVLGGGSNTIFLEDFHGHILINEMKGIRHVETKEYHRLSVSGGENWHNLVAKCTDMGWHGLENLALIPGSVGASPIQNIGAYGVEVCQFITEVDYLDLASGAQHTLQNHECQFGYRDSIFKHALADKVLITTVHFALPKQWKPVCSYGELTALTDPTARQIYDKVIEIRQAKLPDPAILGNAGSFYKNPVVSNEHFKGLKEHWPTIPGFEVDNGVKIPAAWLIDQCGFKGKSTGGVRCHPTQPLVLTNTGEASGADVLSMAKAIIGEVYARFTISLEPEVRLVGKQGLISI